MKHFTKTAAALLLSLCFFVPSVLAVLYYTKPMKDISYNLSLLPEDGQEWEGEKGWTVFTNEAGTRTPLSSNGFGGYLGLDYPGQTFYFSRELTEELDCPALQIGAVNRTISVFLDDTLIYTDCPELDNRIGYLSLPMLEYDRSQPVIVSLPPDYFGRILTIAQATSTFSETQESPDTAWPASVTLYCGYSYESSLIASAARTIIPAVFLLALEFFLLAAFIRNAFIRNFSLSIPVLALLLLFQICLILSRADFFHYYFGILDFDPSQLFFHLSIGTLLLFLTLYNRQLLPLFLSMTAAEWISILLYMFAQSGLLLDYGDWYLFFSNLPQIVGFLSLLASLGAAVCLWKKGNHFFSCMMKSALLLTACYLVFIFFTLFYSADYALSVITRIRGDFGILLPNFSLKLLWALCLSSSLAAVAMDLLEQEITRRAEHEILSVKNKLALESYQNLLGQSEELKMLQHDTMKHYSLLRGMADEAPQRIAPYLDELIGQSRSVRCVIATRNQLLDILLNSKLNLAASKGIHVEIIRSEAPEKLPLTDAELCSLFSNLLDNAIDAASGPQTVHPYIKLNFHCKRQHFIFTCENSISPERARNKKNPLPGHGYGLKIVEQIMSRWGDMVSVEQTASAYRVTIVIPL